MTTENLVNEDIVSERVKIVNLGVIEEMSRERALEIARKAGLDLVQLSNDEIPACKTVDYGKFLYEQKKKRQKNVQKFVTKEMKFRPNTQEHDYQTKLKKIIKFLDKKNRVKVSISFRGREVSHSEIGWDLANRIVTDTGAKTGGPTMENNTINIILEKGE